MYIGLWQQLKSWWNSHNPYLPKGLQWTGTWCVQNRLRDFLHYQVGHWLTLLRWDAFNCTLCFLIYAGTLSFHRYVEQTPGKFVGDTKCEKVRMLHSSRAKMFKYKSSSLDLKMAEINLLTISLFCPRFLLRCAVKGVSPRRRLKSEVI